MRTELEIVRDGLKAARGQVVNLKGETILKVIGRNASNELKDRATKAGKRFVEIEADELLKALDTNETPAVNVPAKTEPAKPATGGK